MPAFSERVRWCALTGFTLSGFGLTASSLLIGWYSTNMQSWCFSHNLEFNTDIDLCLHRTMGSKKTSWIYYSTCAVQVLKDNGKQWAKQSPLLALAVGRRQQQELLFEPQGRIRFCCTCRCRTAARLSKSSSENVNPAKKRVCLKFGTFLFYAYHIDCS